MQFNYLNHETSYIFAAQQKNPPIAGGGFKKNFYITIRKNCIISFDP